MFGTPCAPPPQAAIFHWVWIYKIKPEDNNRKKARAVCRRLYTAVAKPWLPDTLMPPHLT
jgi:hypothetical protein